MIANEIAMTCPHCGGLLAFPQQLIGTQANCPHCNREICLSPIRAITQHPKSEPDVAQSTLICSVILSFLIPIAGFFAGIWLMTKKQSGYGVACMAISIVMGLIWIAIVNS